MSGPVSNSGTIYVAGAGAYLNAQASSYVLLQTTTGSDGIKITGFTDPTGIPPGQFHEVNPPLTLAAFQEAVRTAAASSLLGSLKDKPLQVPLNVDVVTSTDSSGVTTVTGFRDPSAAGALANQLQVVNPPILLSNFQAAIDSAPSTSALASIQHRGLVAPATNTQDVTTATIVYLTSCGPNPDVTGYMYQGQVFNDLPPAYRNLSSSAFAEKISMSFSGPMQLLQGKSYAVAGNSIYSDATVPTEGTLFYGETSGTGVASNSGTTVVYGYRTPSGAQSVFEPPIPLSEFLRQSNMAGSPLRGLSFTMVEAIPGTVVQRTAFDTVHPPGTEIRPNPYLQPSIAALLAILMMKVAQMERDTAMKEDIAIQKTMAASITQVAMSQSAIEKLNDVQRAQAIASIVSSSIVIAGAIASMAMMGVAYNRFRRAASDDTINKPMVSQTPQTSAIPPSSATAGVAAPLTAPPPTSQGPNAVTAGAQQQQQQMAQHTQQQQQVAAAAAAGAAGLSLTGAALAGAPPISLQGSAAPLAVGSPQQQLAPAQQQAQLAQTQQLQQQQQAQQLQQQAQQITPQAVTSTAPTHFDKKQRMKLADHRFDADMGAARSLLDIAKSLGQIVDSATTVATMRQKTAAEQAQAYLQAYKQLNETFRGQLVNDRAQVDNEFKSALEVAKQMMDNEVNILRQMFGLPG